MGGQTAKKLAPIVGGEAWDGGGGIWLAVVNRQDGSLVVLSGDVIWEYENQDAFDEGEAKTSILLTIPDGK